MTKVAKINDIWELKGSKEDFLAGARYAQVSLPWTFNRMALNTSARGQCDRAMNIAKGIVAQEVLRRKLMAKGVRSEVQRKSHRDEDFFDLRVSALGELRTLDLKSWVYYSDYDDLGREPLSRQLIIDNRAHPGPDWRRFFPMLVPVDQTGQGKNVYCFALASSIDFRRDISTNRASQVLASFPFGEYLPFLSSRRLCAEREAIGKGIYLSLTWIPDGMFGPNKLKLVVVGEWDGKPCAMPAELPAGKQVTVGPLSCVASFLIEPESFESWNAGVIALGVRRNDFTGTILNSTRRNVNVAPKAPCVIEKKFFCNLVLPSDYTLYMIGWISKDDLLVACRKYPAWIWPDDPVDRYRNAPWTQMTQGDRSKIEGAGFGDCIKKNPSGLAAGWMKMRACCYVYPNVWGGGLRDTNLYVLPQDLNTMDTLG